MRVREIRALGAEFLENAGVPDASYDAGALLLKAAGWSRTEYLMRQDETIPGEAEEKFRNLIRERASRIPLQQILGEAWFMGLPFLVDARVLTPRADTECLAEWVLEEAESGETLLDLCTGTGCIAISLAMLGSFREVTASDISEEALDAAEGNLARNGWIYSDNTGSFRLPEADGKSEFRLVKSDMFSHLPGRYDIITANPPYIPSGEIPGLMPEVRDYEPHLALDGGEDGLDFYRRLAKEARGHLHSGGRMYLEIGWNQGEAVRGLLQEAGYTGIRIRKDLAAHDRVITARADKEK